MAILPITKLETHPDGTVGAAAIVNTNWERLEEVFDPALSSADDAFEAFWRAVVRSATDPTTENAAILWNTGTNRPRWQAGFASITYAASLSINYEDGSIQEIDAISGTLTFTSVTNERPGGRVVVILRADGTGPHNLNFPASWVFIGGAAPASIAASKSAQLELLFTGTTDADVVARYTVEP